MKLPWRKKQPVRALIGESGPEAIVPLDVDPATKALNAFRVSVNVGEAADPQAIVRAMRAYMRQRRGPWPPPKLGDVYYRGNHTDVIRGGYTGPLHRSARATLAKPPGVTEPLGGPI